MFNFAFASENFPEISNKIEANGRYFEIKNEENLIFSLKSSEEIKVVFETISKMIILKVEASERAFTQLTISGLKPNKIYYKYQDSYKKETIFVSNENGSYSWKQNLNQSHLIWIQETKGTTFIERDTILENDIEGSVEILSSNITLDCKGHKIIGNGEGFGILLVAKERVFIKNCQIENFTEGILFYQAENSKIENVKAKDNFIGIHLFRSNENIIKNNTIIGIEFPQTNYGILLEFSNKNILEGNKVNFTVIYLWNSLENILSKNKIDSSLYGPAILLLENSSQNLLKENEISNNSYGIYLSFSHKNLLSQNTLSKNSNGIYLSFSSENKIVENEIEKSQYYGIYLYSSEKNKIYHNNFVDNSTQAVSYGGSENFFDDDYLLAGNFWSDYQGIDEDGDGIGDTPYYFQGGLDRYPFVKKSAWKVEGQWLIFNFWPKNPIKGVEVKFDASFPRDFSSQITKLEWQIKNASSSEILATSSATTTFYTFSENGNYEIILIATDNDGTTFSTSTILKVKPFSFAIITDLHIGRGYEDYGSEGFDDLDEGEDYYLTKRLEAVVDWIIQNKDKIQCENATCSIKFLAVLGDIADSGEKSEFKKAKKILDRLNDYGIPYVPVFGNHDVWPYTDFEEATSTLGEDYFEEIFWDENATNTKLMKEILGIQREENKKFKNFAFNFGGINFIGLDFNSREKVNCKPCGVKGEGVLHNETINWLKTKLNEWQGREKVIIFSHEPFAEPKSRIIYEIIPIPQERGNFSNDEIAEIKNILVDYENKVKGQQILGNIGGHIHGFDKFGKEKLSFGGFGIGKDLFFEANWQYPPLSTIPVLTSEALMVGSNREDEYLKQQNKGLIRIFKVISGDEMNYETVEGRYSPDTKEGKEFIALNPSLDFDYTGEGIGCVFFKAHAFTKRSHTFAWFFGDGETGSGEWESHCYKKAGEYQTTLVAEDSNTGRQEKITRKIKIPEAAIIPRLLKIKDELKEKVEIISTTLGRNLVEFGRTMKDNVRFFIKHSPSILVGEAIIHFEKAAQDIDFTGLIIDSDLKTGKSILYMPKWPEVIEKGKILFVPIPK